MATRSDQIQADIARTRTRMSGRLDQVGQGRQGGQMNLTTAISEQVRERPLMALGLSLIAGSLLQDYMSGGQTTPTRRPTTGRPSYDRYSTVPPYDNYGGTNTLREGARNVADTVGDAAQSAGQMASDATQSVVDTARNAASAVVDTTTDVAQRVADTAGNVASQVAETAGNVTEEITENAGDLFSTITEQVRQRPLAALGLALAAGSLLQNTGGGQTTSRYPATGRSSYGYDRYSTGPRYDTYGGGTSTLREGARNVTDTVSDAARNVTDTVTDAAQSAGQMASNAARSVADTAGNVASQVAETAGYVTDEVTEQAGDLFSTIGQQIRQRPLVALGLALAAGSLLQNMGGGQTTPRYSMTTRYGYGYDQYGAGPRYDTYGGGTSTLREGARNVTDTVSDAARNVTDTVGDAAQSAGQMASDAARSVADTAGNVASQVAETAGDAAQRVGETVSDLWPAVTRQVQDRPLTALGLAIAAGMLLQPTVTPHVSALTSDVRSVARTIGGSVGELVTLPEPPEVNRIRQAIVPAAVSRARQYVSHDMRDYLDRSLEGMLTQTSMRAGAVAAITERAETLVDNRLPGILNNVSGTAGLLTLGLIGAVLQAQNQAQQGQGQTISNVKNELANSIVQNAEEQLSRYFPEFRQQYESNAQNAQRCQNCGTELGANTRFCPSCGTPVPGMGA